MLDNGRSADQIRAIAQVTFSEAQAASYMASAAKTGWSIADFCEKTGVPMAQARGFAFRFGVNFSDYNTAAKPKVLEWRKSKIGWELTNGSDMIGTCARQVDGRYLAQACGITETMWDARASMRRVSELLDSKSPELFGGKLLKVQLVDLSGKVEDVLFGFIDEATERCRKALAFAPPERNP